MQSKNASMEDRKRSRKKTQSAKPLGSKPNIEISGDAKRFQIKSVAQKRQEVRVKLEAENKKLEENRQLYHNLKSQYQAMQQILKQQKTKYDKYRKKLDLMRQNQNNGRYFKDNAQNIIETVQELYLAQVMDQVPPNGIDIDRMTYEELLELQQKVGKVSRGLTFDQMKTLTRTTLSNIDNPLSDKCPVCTEEIPTNITIVHLRCGHCFHEDCIFGWLKQQKVCPLCKLEVL